MVKQTQCKKGQSWDMGTRKPWANWRPLPNNLPYTLDPKWLHSSTSLKHLPYNIHEIKPILIWKMPHHFWFPPCVALTVNCVLQHSVNIVHSSQASELLRAANCSFACSCTEVWIHKDTDSVSPIPSTKKGLLFVGGNSFGNLFFSSSYCVQCSSAGDIEWWLGSSKERIELQIKIDASRWSKVARIENRRRGNQKVFVIDYMWKTSVREELRMTARWLAGW